MSKPKASYTFGWTDPRMPRLDSYRYEIFVTPDGCEVVKQSLVHQDVVEILASGLTLEVAEGFMKLLKEN